MDAKPAQMSHEEVWDDASLVKSWNQALNEYKKYHSIRAKGEKGLQDLERQASQNMPVTSAEPSLPAMPSSAPDHHTNSAAAQPTAQEVDTQNRPDETEADGSVEGATSDDPVPEVNNAEKPPAQFFQAMPMPPLGPPPAMMDTVHDKNLRNALMSWYLAGYYTGFYEGQTQQAQQP